MSLQERILKHINILPNGCWEVFGQVTDGGYGRVWRNGNGPAQVAMYEFLTQPAIHTCKVEYYWTQIRGANGETYTRDQLPEIMAFFAAKLHRFADAFLTDTWIPKQSGLCNGWCPVTLSREISLSTRMHLDRKQVTALVRHLTRWLEKDTF